MRFLSPLILTTSLFLFSCNQNNTAPTEFGTVDSLAVAADTSMQLGIESSYEFHKTLVASDTLVYDIVGYGGNATKGELAVLKRGANNKADTVFKQTREGMISDVALQNGELSITLKHPRDTTDVKVFKYNLTSGR